MKLFVIPCLVVLLYAEYSPGHRRPSRAVIKGEDAVPHEFPWVVYMDIRIITRFPRLATTRTKCTGSLISPNMVLTAAHCVIDYTQAGATAITAMHARVYAGYHKYPLASSYTKGVVRDAEVFLLPPLPNGHDNYLYYDLAILVLSVPIERSETIDFIELADQNSSMVNHLNSCYAAGFGDTDTKRGVPRVLQKLQYQVLNDTECLFVIKSDLPCGPGRKRLAMKTKNMICAVGTHHARTYEGDSGGPFMCQDDNGKWILYGVNSGFIELFSRAPPVDLFTKIELLRESLVKAIDSYKN